MIYLPRFGTGGTASGIVRNRKAQLPTTPIVSVTWVVWRDSLRVLGEDLDAIQTVGFLNFLHDLLSFSGELIHLDDGVEPPVGDKKMLLVHDKRKWMPDKSGGDGLHIGSIETGVLKKNEIIFLLIV